MRIGPGTPDGAVEPHRGRDPVAYAAVDTSEALFEESAWNRLGDDLDGASHDAVSMPTASVADSVTGGLGLDSGGIVSHLCK